MQWPNAAQRIALHVPCAVQGEPLVAKAAADHHKWPLLADAQETA